jgi:hypothetical protein
LIVTREWFPSVAFWTVSESVGEDFRALRITPLWQRGEGGLIDATCENVAEVHGRSERALELIDKKKRPDSFESGLGH